MPRHRAKFQARRGTPVMTCARYRRHISVSIPRHDDELLSHLAAVVAVRSHSGGICMRLAAWHVTTLSLSVKPASIRRWRALFPVGQLLNICAPQVFRNALEYRRDLKNNHKR